MLSRFLICSLFALPAIQADVVNSVQCFNAAAGLQQGTQSCAAPLQTLAGGQSGFAYADATAVYALPVNAASWTATTLKDFTMTNDGWVNDGYSAANASATTTLTLNLFTVGTPRPGYIEFYFPESNFESWLTSDGDSYGAFDLTIGGLTVSCGSGDSFNANKCGANNQSGGYYDFYRDKPQLLPWTLGTSFTLTETAKSQSNGELGFAETGVNAEVLFKFVEADGVTPVTDPDAATPEPVTWLLAALPLAALVLFARRGARAL